MSDRTPSAWRRRERSRDLTGLGWLEADVLRVVWDNGTITVRDVYEHLRESRRIAYTTVMSVLRNLAVKGLLEQDKSRSAYVRPAQSHRRRGRPRHPGRPRRQDHGGPSRASDRLPAAAPRLTSRASGAGGIRACRPSRANPYQKADSEYGPAHRGWGEPAWRRVPTLRRPRRVRGST